VASGAGERSLESAKKLRSDRTNSPPQRDTLLRDLAKLGENDTDNGRRLNMRYRDLLRFVPERKEWFAFNGQIWCEDTAKRRVIFAQRSARLIAKEAQHLDAERHTGRRQWAQQSLGAAAVKRGIEMAQQHATRSITEFDREPWLLNVKNGTLDLRTGCLRQFDAADHLTRLAARATTKRQSVLSSKAFCAESLAGTES